MIPNGRMSARFIANHLGMSTNRVYELWEKMGYVFRDSHGFWGLTEAGKALNGRYSKGGGVPTFKFEEIVPLMRRFCSLK